MKKINVFSNKREGINWNEMMMIMKTYKGDNSPTPVQIKSPDH